MWKVGDLVKQRTSIFRIEEVAGKPMLVVEVIYSKGKTSGWPLEVITQCDGRLYHWNPDGLVSYTGPSGDWTNYSTRGGSSWD